MNAISVIDRPNSNKAGPKYIYGVMRPRYRAGRIAHRIWADFHQALSASRTAHAGMARLVHAACLANIDEHRIRTALARALGDDDTLGRFQQAAAKLQAERFSGLRP